MLAYTQSPSVEQGTPLVLCVEPGHRFRVAFYRQSGFDAFHLMSHITDLAGNDVAPTGTKGGPTIRESNQDWNWPSVSYPLQAPIFPSAVYVALVHDPNEPPPESLGHLTSNAAMFVVTPANPTAAIAYILPIATMQAYNFTGGACFYEYRDPPAAPSRTVTWRRPGCGIGGESREAKDPYDPASPRQAFLHWDAKMIGFLTASGFAVDCYTDLDLDQRDFLAIAGYRLMISAGHHEYWSEPMREHLLKFLHVGGNAAIFSGNTCYRKISFNTAAATITKENEAWPDSNEAALVGVSYSQGGGWWGTRKNGIWTDMERSPTGYTVVEPGHWVFEDVALPADLTFGAPERLLGYECDGVVPGISPPNVKVLARAHLLGGWNNGEGHTATMVELQHGPGTVFNAATTDWARLLAAPDSPSYPAVARITRNIVTKLSAPRMMDSNRIIQGLWIGSSLSAMERLCISSFMHHGHEFHLYVYGDVDRIPAGTVVRDAGEILPSSAIFQYANGSYAGFANFFRYKLLLERGGWWVDLDTICLKPFNFAAEYVFASHLQKDGGSIVCAGMIKSPAGSAFCEFAWRVCKSKDPQRLVWGETGPALTSEAVTRLGLQQYVLPAETFCPVHGHVWESIFDGGFVHQFGPETYAVHLWNELWRREGLEKDRSYDPGCLYELLRARYPAP